MTSSVTTLGCTLRGRQGDVGRGRTVEEVSGDSVIIVETVIKDLFPLGVRGTWSKHGGVISERIGETDGTMGLDVSPLRVPGSVGVSFI